MQSVNTAQKKKSRRNLLLVLAAFALPIILAKMALELNWLDYGVTNKGQLIDQELTLNQIGIDQSVFNENWLLLYTLPKQCDDLCEKTLESVHNTYVALGREMPRVTPVSLTQTPLSSQQKNRIAQSKWHIMPTTTEAQKTINDSTIFVVDPLGNIILQYKTPMQANELSQFGKQILADMKKLLKYSKIG